MLELQNLPSLLEILYFKKKRDLVRHCRNAIIYQVDFAAFILACETGTFSWNHQIFYRDYVPPHLPPTQENLNSLASNGVGPLRGEAAKVMNRIAQIFEERRLLVGHMFYDKDISNWHFFYFDQRDLSNKGNHWKEGSHIHLINHLWPNYDAESLWNKFCSGNIQLSGSLHIKFVDIDISREKTDPPQGVGASTKPL